MPAFESIDYSLRPSKNIERQIIFDGIRILISKLDLANMVYIGFGSMWFTDFIMAHKLLGISDMVSMEKDYIGYRRALFNRPYATVKVRQGESSQLLAGLPKKLYTRPWVIWLDYEDKYSESIREDIRFVIEKSPENTIFLVTFLGRANAYGHVDNRVEHLNDLFRDEAFNLSKENCRGGHMQETLANLTIDFMQSVAQGSRRPGGFKSAFRVIYEDTAPMVTVGGILADSNASRAVSQIINAPSWRCRPKEHVVAPRLTIREAAILQSMLPNPNSKILLQKEVRKKGLYLKNEQLRAFEKYYREYPMFAQIIS